MGFLDSLFGRSPPPEPDLDALFALPSAAVGIEAATGLRPTGAAGVAFKPVAGAGFDAVDAELADLLALSAERSDSEVGTQEDDYAYRWVTVRDPDVEDLVGTVHLVTRTLVDHGFGPRLLCALFGFGRPDAPDEPLHLVYLYKRGTFYPFAPRGGETRDNETELRLRGVLGDDLPLEGDLSRWFPLWGVPLA